MSAKLLRWSLLPLIAVLILGCIPSLNPVYTEQDLIFDPSILGTWVQNEGNEKAIWEFSKTGEKKYRLVYTDKERKQGTFVAHLAEIDGVTFLDLFPEKVDTDASGFYDFHLVPIHTIYRVKGTQPGLHLAAIDFKWLEKQFAEHPDSIQHATFQNRKLITAPTVELQHFVTAHKDAFTGDFKLKRSEPPAN